MATCSSLIEAAEKLSVALGCGEEKGERERVRRGEEEEGD
jgi:hypothetical protein